MADVEAQYQLSQEQIDFFLENGWIKLSNCFTREQAEDFQSLLWTRLGMDPNDMSTWYADVLFPIRRRRADMIRTKEWVNMPHFHEFEVSKFAPRAWGGICSLLGGASHVDSSVSTWKDSFIVNLGTSEGHGKMVKPQELTNWHVDGDFFVHYLDSPEQGLLVIPLWSDIMEGGGGTMICPGAIKHVAKHLEKEREGVSPRMTPRRENPDFNEEKGLEWYIELAKTMPDEAFVEATGVVGDVYLLHPLMMHSRSNNQLRNVRVITNPPVSVKEPFKFDREDGNFCPVERATLKALGKDRLEGWKIEAERQQLVPERVRIQEAAKKEEEERVKNLEQIQAVSEETRQVYAVA